MLKIPGFNIIIILLGYLKITRERLSVADTGKTKGIVLSAVVGVLFLTMIVVMCMVAFKGLHLQ